MTHTNDDYNNNSNNNKKLNLLAHRDNPVILPRIS